MSASLEKALITVVLFVVTVLVFFATGALTKTHLAPAWLITRWDPYIPLVPIAVWPYFSWYVSPLPLLAGSRQDFRRIACAVVLAFAISILGFIVFPASIQRPVIAGGTPSERALLLLYKYDPPWNIFPSFHAALCAILWRPVFGGRLARILMPVWMSTICVACVLTRQHHLLDIVAGLLLGFFALAAVTAIFNQLEKAKLTGPRPEEPKSCLPVAGTGRQGPLMRHLSFASKRTTQERLHRRSNARTLRSRTAAGNPPWIHIQQTVCTTETLANLGGTPRFQ